MHPVLFEIVGFPIHTYGVLIATGFLLAVLVAKRDSEKIGLPGEKIVDLAFWCLLVGLIGSRILFVITRWEYFYENPLHVFYLWEGGLVFFAGPLTCIPFIYWYTKRYKLPRLKVLDILSHVIPLAHGFGRLGCLSAGCCHGKPTTGNWGIKLYSDLVEPGLRGVYLHPTQLYESVLLFSLFFLLRYLRRKQKFDGQILLYYLVFYSVIRSVVEVFRGDSIRGFVIPGVLSTSQFIALLVVIGCIWYGHRIWKRNSQS